MSLGDGKYDQGNKGSHFGFEFNALRALGLIAVSAGGSATEATLQAVLTAINQHQDFELKLVRDTGNADKVVCEKAEYDEQTATYSYTYEDVGGAAYVVVGPLEYLDPDATLNLLLTESLAQGLTLDDIELNTDDNATEATLALINGKLAALGQKASAGSMPVVLSTEQETLIDGLETLLTSIDADTSNLDVALSTVAKEATLLLIDTVLDNILLDTSVLATPVTGLAMGLVRATDATGSPIAAGKRRISVLNAGGADGTVLGATIKKGEFMSWSADGLRDTLAAFSYDGTGTELIITTVG